MSLRSPLRLPLWPASLLAIVWTFLLPGCSPGPSEFRQAGCASCHMSQPSGSGPSISEITAAYAGNEDEIAAFLRGERVPRVDPARAAAMQPALQITRQWSEQQRTKVARFLAGKDWKN